MSTQETPSLADALETAELLREMACVVSHLASEEYTDSDVPGISGSIEQALELSAETVDVSHHTSDAGKNLQHLAGELRALVREFKT